jgi:hypothetical protein
LWIEVGVMQLNKVFFIKTKDEMLKYFKMYIKEVVGERFNE